MLRIFLAFLFLSISLPAYCGDPLRDYLEAQTRYWGIQERVSEDQLNTLVKLKKKADQPGLSQEDRTKAYTELFQFAQKLRGLPEGRVPAALAASYWSEGEPPVPVPIPSAKPAELQNVIKRGNGKIPAILIPDLGGDWTVFDSFMQRNSAQFTFYAITLPGFGGTNPPPERTRMDFGTLEWWTNAMTGVIELIQKEKLNKPVILGHQAGAYLAMELALRRPDLTRAVIVVNGLLYAPIPGIQGNATKAERIRIVNSWTPAELFPNTSEAQYRSVLMQNANWFCKDPKRQEYLVSLIAKSRSVIWWNYFAELATTDLSKEIQNLKVPMLVLPAIYDRGLPGFEAASKTALDQWLPLDGAKSSLPIHIVKIDDSRAYIMEDQPAKFDHAIRTWMQP
jgi:pimeloyl-ACP methyl ester carboxylesterase